MLREKPETKLPDCMIEIANSIQIDSKYLKKT